jgi:16S rRNA (cytosine967-C5)-methyltransferase
MAAVSPARNAAFQILMSVERGKAHSDDLLRSKMVANLSLQDRNLATALVLGVLRWQIRLDRQIQSQLARPKAKLDPEVLVALRLGAFQLRHLDRIPARAAIDESVELAKLAGHRFASRMVNAVLRKLADASDPKLPEGNAAELALAQAHPEWMVERWVGFYGLDAARAICRHGQEQSAVAIRIASLEAERGLTAAGIQLEPGEVLTAARTAVSGDVTSTEAFRKGIVRPQDEGSQLVAEIAGRGTAILDCCAAPGGKTLILAERNPDAHIVACEVSEARLRQLRKRLAPFGERIEFQAADATALTEEGKYDLVLADVPCSGTGTLGRNPEIRHRLRVEDLPRQAARQREILRAALRAVRPGGRVVYSTCSLEPEENEQVVAAVLGETPWTRLASIQDRIDELLRDGIVMEKGANLMGNCITQEGYLRLLPGKTDTDGFFVALIEKTTAETT